MRLTGSFLLLLSFAGVALAGTPNAPEIDGGTAVSAVALLAGSVMILRGRLRK